MEKIFILDALGYLFRSYYAIRNLSRKTGESTNALYGFVRSVLKVIQDFNPTYLVAVFDGPHNTKKRAALYPDYKANRLHPPEDLPYQLDWAYEFCELANIPRLRIPEVEADDVMATLAIWASKNKHQVYICSSDKDLFQLVNEQIFIVNTNKDNLIYHPKDVKEHYGVWPSQIRDYLAIVGDSSDNVPGIKGFGPKTAQSLLEQSQTLDELIAFPEKYLNDKKLAVFQSHLPLLEISRALVTLDTDIDIPHDLSFYKLNPPQSDRLRIFFEDMNFKSLASEFQQSMVAPAPILPTETRETPVVNDSALLDKLIQELSVQSEICFDTETTGLHPISAEIVGLGVGYAEDKIWYIPFNDRINREELIHKLKPLFENPRIGFYGHNVKYDLHILKNAGIDVCNVCGDTVLLSYLLTPNLRQHSLDDLSLEYFHHQKISITHLIGTGKAQKSMLEVPILDVANYCGEDVLMTLKLKEVLEEKVKEQSLFSVYQNIELPLVKVLFGMERYGIFIDCDQLNQLKHTLSQRLVCLQEEVYKLAGEHFNLNSTKQLAEILFQKLAINPSRKTKTGFSTSADALEELQSEHPIIEKIIEYRTLEKLRSTYIESLIEETYDKTKRVHCSFNQTITATGRLSCQSPNLQNIPIKTEQGREVREAFRPQKEGWSYLSADYSQIELRLLAHYSEDETLLNIFKQNGDVHTITAAKIFNIPQNEVKSEHRSLAKAVNFGILYGQQAFGLSKQLRISLSQAKDFINAYFKQYPKVSEYINACIHKAEQLQYTESLFGRKRPLPEINSKNKLLKQAADRLAINSPFQGTNADIIKLAMIKIDKLLSTQNKKSFMLLQIHDELLFECLDSEVEEISYHVKQIMENIVSLKVPLTVNLKIGKNWKEC